jgi:hypothetical protein
LTSTFGAPLERQAHAVRCPIFWGKLLEEIEVSPNGLASAIAPVNFRRLWNVATAIVKEYPSIPLDGEGKAIMPFTE